MSSGHHPIGGDQRSSASVSPLGITQVLQRDLWRKKKHPISADPDTKNKRKAELQRRKETKYLPGPAVWNGVHSIDHAGGEGLDGRNATPQS